MFFLPVAFIIFLLFILFLPFLFILGYFQVLFFGQIASADTQSALEVKLNSSSAAAISRRALIA